MSHYLSRASKKIKTRVKIIQVRTIPQNPRQIGQGVFLFFLIF